MSRFFEYCLFSHHYQGNLDFNTVNIHRTVGMYFLIFTSFRDDVNDMIYRDRNIQYTPLGVYWEILPLGHYFLIHSLQRISRTDPRAETPRLVENLSVLRGMYFPIHPSSRQCMNTVFSYHVYLTIHVNTAKHSLIWFNCLQRI